MSDYLQHQLVLATANMTKQPSPKTRKTKMTDKPTVEKAVDNLPVQATLPAVAPAAPAVDKPPAVKTGWAFDKAVLAQEPKGVGAGGTNGTGLHEAKGVMLPQHEVPKDVDPLLVDMLCWPRSHNSPEELAFTKWLQDHIIKNLKQTVMCHAEGAFSVDVPLQVTAPSDGKPMLSTTLFSCHVDTVDVKMTDPATRKKLTYDPGFGTIALDSQSAGNCLGADDTAGIWLMLKMIEAKVPGTYLFHRGEECGGVSAKAIASKEIRFLQRFQCAVAFDRKDTGDIVTVQGGARCASPKFAGRLADMLHKLGFGYKESLTGSYTDVKEYRRIIPEVVNLSCGYDGAHSRNETLDYAHLAAMAVALPDVEWESLPIDRDPGKPDPVTSAGYSTGKWSAKQRFINDGLFDDDDLRQWGKANGAKKKSALVAKGAPPADAFVDKGFEGMTWQEIEDAIADDTTWAVEHIVGLLRRNAQQRADIETLQSLMGM